jgi:F-type H+-transporting ATPase subunit gamma
MVANMRTWHDEGVEAEICTIGAKAASFFNNFGGKVVASVRNIGEKPTVADVIGAVKVMLDAYMSSEIDRLFLVSNEFVNTMTQRPTVEQLLPLKPADASEYKHHWDYIYEPAPKELLDGLLTRYIESLVYQAVVENNASEQAARMVAMKSATDNAGDLIDELQLVYNKARQASITQELSEIVGGAAAV